MEGRIEDTLLQNQINAAGGGGGTPLITSQDETPVVAATTTMEYQGDGVTVTAGDSGIAIVNIPGGGGKTGFSPVNLGSSDTSFAFDANTVHLHLDLHSSQNAHVHWRKMIQKGSQLSAEVGVDDVDDDVDVVDDPHMPDDG